MMGMQGGCIAQHELTSTSVRVPEKHSVRVLISGFSVNLRLVPSICQTYSPLHPTPEWNIVGFTSLGAENNTGAEAKYLLISIEYYKGWIHYGI